MMISICCITALVSAQQIKGTVIDDEGAPLSFANVTLFKEPGSIIFSTAMTDENGAYIFEQIPSGVYQVEVSYLGLGTGKTPSFEVLNKDIQLDPIDLRLGNNELAEVTIVGRRPMIEVKPDRTTFNVQGTINAAGDNGLQLLRKAPGIVLDNNDNIIMMGRTGVLIYVDGKQLMLTGDDLINYLQNLTADQIDKIEIITNPGSKYDAQGNAGIIDIRLKKDKNLGFNGSIALNGSQGRYAQSNGNTSGNFRGKKFNVFGNTGGNYGNGWNDMKFDNYQNNLRMQEGHNNTHTNRGTNFRLGGDYFLTPQHTIGVLVSGNDNTFDNFNRVNTRISGQATPDVIDSILLARNIGVSTRHQRTYNLNYAFQGDQGTFNFDFDHGNFVRFADHDQPNLYYDATLSNLLTQVLTAYSTPSNIGITTLKGDYETTLWGGNLGAGSKYSHVRSDNTFLFYHINEGLRNRDDKRSNNFIYDESVTAGYVNYNRSINKAVSVSGGLRAEHTAAVGELNTFSSELSEDPVVFDYLSWFPSLGITFASNPKHSYGLNYSKRINRPDYRILNPFREQASELVFSKGNPFLQPEIAHNLEFNYTFGYRYNFKIAYSHTDDKIVRLISPDELDPRAGFITWENLAKQKIWSANLAAPVSIAKWWDAFFNITTSLIDNQAVYDNGSRVDVQAMNINIYQQQTFSLPKGYKVEFSGWFSGPGVWEGVMRTDPMFALNFGVQRKFWDNKINVRLNFSDIFFSSTWSGVIDFNGLEGSMSGGWDSRRVNLSVSYDFGNKNVKSRKRQTGLDAEAKRVGEG
jgi:iron complex outermembrane receptor protein